MTLLPEAVNVAAPRGDEIHAPLLANPYPQGSEPALQYEHGYKYAQTLGHVQLSASDPTYWKERPIPWREGFAKAAGQLGLKQYDILKSACLADMPECPVLLLDIDGTLVAEGISPQTLIPGRLEALRALKDKGVKMFCITNRSSYVSTFEEVEAGIEAFIDLCEGLIDQVYWMERPGPLQKPCGFMIRACMQQNGFGPDQALFVGNSENDEAAAADAGVGYADHQEFFDSFKAAEWSSEKNREIHAIKHGPEFGGADNYVSFEQALMSNPELRSTFKPVNMRCDNRGCTTAAYSPHFRMMHVVNEDGKTVTLYRKDKDVVSRIS